MAIRFVGVEPREPVHMLYAAAAETGVPLNTIRVDALSAVGVILAVIAGGSLIKPRK